MERRYRIMLIEDSRTQAAQLRSLLEGESAEVQCAYSAEEGLDDLNRSIPDLIVVDYYLPGLKGDEFCRKIRMNVNTRSVPVLMLTVGGDEMAETRGLESGADDYLAKSVDPDILRLRVRALLRKSRAHDAILGSAEAVFSRGRLLAIDDSPTYLRYLAEQLRTENCDVATAGSGAEGLERLAREAFDCVLVDLAMPGLDGIEVCRRIGQARRAADSPIVVLMLEGDEGKDQMTRGLAAGADDFVGKAGDIAVLKARVRALLRRKFVQDENRRILEELKNRELEAVRARAEREAAEARAILAERLAQTDRELRFQHGVTAAITENAADALFMLDPQGRVTFLNPAAVEMSGFGREELLGHALDRLVQPEASGIPPALARVFETGETIKGQEGVFARKDGSTIDVSCSYSPVSREGKVTAAVLVVHDISEQKRNEERLRQTQKLESIGLLAGGIAHDFNNLLTGILGNASLLASVVPQDLGANVDSIINASERAAELTRQLLAYAGKGRFVVEPVDLSEMVRHLTPLIRTSIGRTIELKLELDPRLPAIEADRSQIQQVVMNLAINAGEAVGEKAGRIAVRTGWRHLDAAEAGGASVIPGEYVWLQVADTGCGIGESDRAKIFEPFFTTKFTGRGLGLAAVHGIVRMCKGAIQVESTPGKGSVFTVLFPAVPRVSLPVPEVGAEEETAGAGVVLVVDDEAIVRLTAEAALAKYGYAALLAADGQEGVDMFARHARIIDVVLLDVKMPIMDGHEALERMQRIQPDVKVLVSSGYNESAALEAFKHQGVAGFVQKPYRAGTLVKAIRGVMEQNGNG